MNIPKMSSAPSPSTQSSKPQRVLACMRCQQRKIKCDRRFPCSNCSTSLVQCVPATLTRRGQRRRRFPERELLERLRKYEDLLRQNNIKFEPLHKDQAGEKESPITQGGNESEDELPEVEGASPSTSVKSERVYEVKSLWDALNSVFRDPDDDSDYSNEEFSEAVVKKGWSQVSGDNDYLLFGSPQPNVDLSILHPEPVQIFRLWQIYLDNVNPLLKVTHYPSLQGSIIEAAGNLTNISPTLEALMFGIYCMAVVSLAVDDCQAIFGSVKEDLLTRFRFGCQQALLNCRFLQSSDRDCLTALLLYLISVRHSTVPQSLSSMLGVAIRIAHRMGIHRESVLAKCSVLEAELRRRLWWSLVLFDARISELAAGKTATLTPTWDCKIPLNVNDSDLRPEMKEPPVVQGKSTDALFAVVRSELGEFLRHSTFYLDFTDPALKPIIRATKHCANPEVIELATLEKKIDDQYLKFCDLENPLHLMTIWWTRSFIAKCSLLEHHSRYSSLSEHQADAQRDVALSHALRMLEYDTKFMASPVIERFLWLINFYFPFPAYVQIIQDLKKRPTSEQAEQAWEVISDNCEARLKFPCKTGETFFYTVFTKMISLAWEAREAAFSQLGEPLIPPRVVTFIRHRLAQNAQHVPGADTQQPSGTMGVGIDNFPLSMPVGSGSHSLPYNMEGQGGYGVTGFDVYSDISGQVLSDIDMNQLDWSAVDWGFGGVYSGSGIQNFDI